MQDNNHLASMADVIGSVEAGWVDTAMGLKLVRKHIPFVTAVDFLETFWAKGKTLKDRYRTLKMGNDKLHKSIGIWSLPAVDSCPNCSDCKAKCYALSPQRMRSNVRRSRFLNWILAEYYPSAFGHQTIVQIKRDKVKTVRIHESGDFYRGRYVWQWEQIAKHCPETKFFFYTKTAWRELEQLTALPNVNMVQSILPDGDLNFGTPDYVAEKKAKFGYPVCPATDHRLDQDKVKCGKTCKLCQTRPNVLFFIH